MSTGNGRMLKRNGIHFVAKIITVSLLHVTSALFLLLRILFAVCGTVAFHVFFAESNTIRIQFSLKRNAEFLSLSDSISSCTVMLSPRQNVNHS